jgi:hypothetical protein
VIVLASGVLPKYAARRLVRAAAAQLLSVSSLEEAVNQNAWLRRIVPERSSERSAFVSFLIGFVLEAASELHQFAGHQVTPGAAAVAYFGGLASALLGFYFFWRGGFEWSRLPHAAGKTPPHRSGRFSVAIAVAGIASVAVWNVAAGTVGVGDTPFPLAWLVGGIFVWAVVMFFLSLRDRLRPFHGAVLSIPGWVALAWAFGVATVSGLLLGQTIVGLFVDFFTNWNALFDALGPFVDAVSPLFVAFALISVVYAACLTRTSPREELLVRPRKG